LCEENKIIKAENVFKIPKEFTK